MAADAGERQGVLEEDRERGQGSSGDEVVRLAVLGSPPELLGARRDDRDPRQPEPVDEAAHRLRLLADRVEKGPGHLRPGQREDDAGDPASGADVERSTRRQASSQRTAAMRRGDGARDRLRLDDPCQVHLPIGLEEELDEALDRWAEATRKSRQSPAPRSSSARRAARASVDDKRNAPRAAFRSSRG